MLNDVLKEMGMEFSTGCGNKDRGRMVSYRRMDSESEEDMDMSGEEDMGSEDDMDMDMSGEDDMGSEDDMGMSDEEDTLTVDVPFLIRVFELVREEIKDDATLHQLVDDLLEMGREGTLTMDNYGDIQHYESGDEMGSEEDMDMSGEDDMGSEDDMDDGAEMRGPITIESLLQLSEIHGMRNPKSKSEMKAIGSAKDQGVKVRGKRSLKNLPNAWDDKFSGTQRSWKKRRKTQYKK